MNDERRSGVWSGEVIYYAYLAIYTGMCCTRESEYGEVENGERQIIYAHTKPELLNLVIYTPPIKKSS